jgi:AcrR family transcriptional regulator
MALMEGTAPLRRTQEQRTADTTAAVLNATVDCLVELGFGRTTVADVAKRAQVSRSAVLYHYGSKNELFVAAIDHLVALRTEEVAAVLSALPADAGELERLEGAIDVMWSIYRGPTMVAWLELAIAARTDHPLHDLMVAHTRRFDESMAADFRRLFPPAPEVPALFYEVAPVFLHALLKGLATDRLGRDPADADAIADLTIFSLKTLLRLVGTIDPDTILHQMSQFTDRSEP